MIGKTISQYKILEKLGEGGMGVVYKAEDLKLHRPVALKFLPAHLSASEKDEARLRQEAQAASALNHPNVCTIHDFQDHDGQFFIVMEFVDGETLKSKIKQGSVGNQETLALALQIAQGLKAAHDKGIIHRDIKPENIIVTADNRAKIMDFGISRSVHSEANLTKTGKLVGTPYYMSPEQIEGQSSDPRSDIFSFGIVLYEMLTGQRPFGGDYELAVIYAILHADPAPLSDIDPSISGA